MMAYKTIMPFLDLLEGNIAALNVACDLADRFDAKIIGITAGLPNVPVHPGGMGGIVGTSILEADYDQLNNAILRCEQQFLAAVKPCEKPTEFRVGIGPPADFLASEARAADLIVVGASETSHFLMSHQFLDISDALLKAGKPILKVPPDTTSFPIERIVIAWKDSTEARRAVTAALPLLHAARDVRIVSLVDDERHRDEAKAGVSDVVEWLYFHKIRASGSSELSAGVPAKELEAIASDFRADLIVAGAYGHSRMREWVLGGVTRQLLNQRQIATFLVH